MPKSAAQIRRMQKRAQGRGDSYVAPERPKPVIINASGFSEEEERKIKAAETLQENLTKIEQNVEELNSKDRRSAKRKAEAIAIEQLNGKAEEKGDDDGDDDDDDNDNDKKSISNAEELLEWYNKHKVRINKTKKASSSSSKDEKISKVDKSRLNAFTKYKSSLEEIENNEELKSKDRRSHKRKAEAIAIEESKFESIQELTDWYDENPQLRERMKESDMNKNGDGDKKPNNPYILFVGQIPYSTTEDDILKHFQKYVGKKDINKESMRIRIPKDQEKNKKMLEKKKKKQQKQESQGDDDDTNMMGADDLYDYEVEEQDKLQCRGFAFAEFNDPELMYECLKLHHTDLNGRRINVIRSAGGGKEARKEKHKQRRIEQDEYISTTVDKIIQDYIARGELQDGELDEGAVLLCKRRSAAIVEAALTEYIEQRAGKDLENPSSFFMRVICNVTEDGEAGTQASLKKKKQTDNSQQNKKRKFERDGGSKPYNKDGSILGGSSVLAKAGVDMSVSQKAGGGEKGMVSIFPSMRGRGRGRGGYM